MSQNIAVPTDTQANSLALSANECGGIRFWLKTIQDEVFAVKSKASVAAIFLISKFNPIVSVSR